MLPGHKTNGAPRKSNLVAFPLVKWRGMAERKGILMQPKGLHWGGQSLKLSSQQREAVLISLVGKLIQKKGGEGTPPCGKINNPFGSLWVSGGCLLLGFDCSTLWSRFHMLVYCFDSKCKRITQRDPERISNTSDFSQTLSKFADVSCGFRSDATKSRLPKLKGHLQIFAITTL